MGCFLERGEGLQGEDLTVGRVWAQALYVLVWRALELQQRLVLLLLLCLRMRMVPEIQLVGKSALGLLVQRELVSAEETQ